MGWGGAGLGASEQGIAEPIKGGEIRDRNDMYRGEFPPAPVTVYSELSV